MAVKPSSSASAGGKAMEVAPPSHGKNTTSFLQKNTTFFTKSIILLAFPVFLHFGKIPLTVLSGTAETSVHHVLSY